MADFLSQPAELKGAEKRSWLSRHLFLILRRFTQFAILFFFVSGPALGIWIFRGNYSSSEFLDTIPMTDPLTLLQSIATGYWPAFSAILGAILILAAYAALSGKIFCSWVCPFNLVADLAAGLRRKFDIRANVLVSNRLRYFILAGVLLASMASGVLVWEWFNPIGAMGRGIITAAGQPLSAYSFWQIMAFSFGSGLWLISAIFLFDLFVVKHGWCGHVCPVGAFWGLVGRFSTVYVSAKNRQKCDKCMNCITICPEPQVLPKPLFSKQGSSLISSSECTRCGRCIDVCPESVFSIEMRLPLNREKDG